MRAAERLSVGQTAVGARIKLVESNSASPQGNEQVPARVLCIGRSAPTTFSGRIKPSADKAGVAYDIERVADHVPAEAIVEVAEARKCDLIVMASYGRRRLAKLLLGSETLRVLNVSSILGARVPLITWLPGVL